MDIVLTKGNSRMGCTWLEKAGSVRNHSLIPFGKSPGFNPGMNGDFFKAGGSPGLQSGGAPPGFTLIEFMCVVIIISVMIAVSLPQINKYFDTLELSSFSRDLQVFMNYLCQRAIVERKIIYLNIDQDKKQYWAYTIDEGNILKIYHIPDRIRVVPEQKQIVFYPDGAIDKVSIKLMNRDNQYVSLTTRRVFGGAKLEF